MLPHKPLKIDSIIQNPIISLDRNVRQLLIIVEYIEENRIAVEVLKHFAIKFITPGLNLEFKSELNLGLMHGML